MENIKYIIESLDSYEDENRLITFEKIYVSESDETKATFRNKSKMFYEFLQAGYKKSGLGEFRGFGSYNDFKRKCNLYIAAYADEKLIALSVHNGYLHGYKCVGMTITTDEQYHDIAVNSLYEIIKDNIDNYKEWVWIEASGAIDHMHSKCGAFAIPVELSSEILSFRNVSITPCDDNYHYTRNFKVFNVSTGEYEDIMMKKIIYGFNSEETYNKYITYINNNIDKELHQTDDKLDESTIYAKTPKEYNRAYAYMLYYIDLFSNFALTDITKEIRGNIRRLCRTLETGLSKNVFDKKLIDYVKYAIEDGYNIAYNFKVVKPVNLVDTLHQIWNI